jgi:hypothetical protein
MVIRTLVFVYEEHYAWVRWGVFQSQRFPITNGTRQGSMVSHALWSVYLNMLIKELRELGVGCHFGGLYTGVVVCADYVLLMAPTSGAMQTMLGKCEEYAAASNFMFSTDIDPV